MFYWQGDNKEQCSTNSSGIESEKTYTSTKNTINKMNKSGDSPNKLTSYAMQEKEIEILEKPSPKTESEVCSWFYLHCYLMLWRTSLCLLVVNQSHPALLNTIYRQHVPLNYLASLMGLNTLDTPLGKTLITFSTPTKFCRYCR